MAPSTDRYSQSVPPMQYVPRLAEECGQVVSLPIDNSWAAALAHTIAFLTPNYLSLKSLNTVKVDIVPPMFLQDYIEVKLIKVI